MLFDGLFSEKNNALVLCLALFTSVHGFVKIMNVNFN